MVCLAYRVKRFFTTNNDLAMRRRSCGRRWRRTRNLTLHLFCRRAGKGRKDAAGRRPRCVHRSDCGFSFPHVFETAFPLLASRSPLCTNSSWTVPWSCRFRRGLFGGLKEPWNFLCFRWDLSACFFLTFILQVRSSVRVSGGFHFSGHARWAVPKLRVSQCLKRGWHYGVRKFINVTSLERILCLFPLFLKRCTIDERNYVILVTGGDSSSVTVCEDVGSVSVGCVNSTEVKLIDRYPSDCQRLTLSDCQRTCLQHGFPLHGLEHGGCCRCALNLRLLASNTSTGPSGCGYCRTGDNETSLCGKSRETIYMCLKEPGECHPGSTRLQTPLMLSANIWSVQSWLWYPWPCQCVQLWSWQLIVSLLGLDLKWQRGKTPWGSWWSSWSTHSMCTAYNSECCPFWYHDKQCALQNCTQIAAG